MKNKKIKLSELIESPITGEWGKEIGKSENPNTVKVIRTTNFTNSGEINYSNITLRDIESQKCEKKRLKYGDIILEKSGGTDLNPVGRVVFFDKDDTNDIYLTNNFTTILRVKDKRINSKFLLLFLLYNYKYRGLHKFYNKTTGIQNLQVSNFINQVFVPLPEIEIQNKIIKVLENIKTVIKKQKEQLELLENLKKSQFFEMFGDPIKNEKGWEIKKLGNLLKVQGGYAFKSKDFVKRGIKLIQIGNVYLDDIDWENINQVPDNYLEKYKEFKLKEKDIVIAMTRPIIKSLESVKISIVKKKDLPCLLNQRVGRFILSENINKVYLIEILKHKIFKNYVEKMSGNSLQPNISNKDIENFTIIYPKIELQNKFAAKIEAIQKLKFEIEKSLKETENLYNSLMQKFFSNK